MPFVLSISNKEIAKQIAILLNKYNKLTIKYNTEEILLSPDTYVIETEAGTVTGVAAINKKAYAVSELHHVVVHPAFRKRGIAKHLVITALNKSSTPIVYATIRSENKASINVFTYCGFINAGKYITGKRGVYFYVAVANAWKNLNKDTTAMTKYLLKAIKDTNTC